MNRTATQFPSEDAGTDSLLSLRELPRRRARPAAKLTWFLGGRIVDGRVAADCVVSAGILIVLERLVLFCGRQPLGYFPWSRERYPAAAVEQALHQRLGAQQFLKGVCYPRQRS
mmetsp:Transcript_12303/g.27385  ORF Transcript_12303/g.27385 Transcript_12303/m.27385 type:complete len:114 (-) Transcript_12303:32-373(-)